MGLFGCSGQRLLAFLGFENQFFRGISYTNTPKTAFRSQLRDITSQQRSKLFQFCKKFLNPHIPNFQNQSNKIENKI